MPQPFVSKSKFLWGLQCQKLLWHACNARHRIPSPDAQQQAIFDQCRGVDPIALLELFLKFEYQRRVAAGHPSGDEAAEVLRLGPLIQQSISYKLDQRAELLVTQSDWGDQQRVEALENWINWAAEDHQIGGDAGIEGIIVAS